MRRSQEKWFVRVQLTRSSLFMLPHIQEIRMLYKLWAIDHGGSYFVGEKTREWIRERNSNIGIRLRKTENNFSHCYVHKFTSPIPEQLFRKFWNSTPLRVGTARWRAKFELADQIEICVAFNFRVLDVLEQVYSRHSFISSLITLYYILWKYRP